ncbi:MAG: HIT family protein [Nanoarchaeota archaeon]|nr:HIT family protein [Nanoarchaeota archaeon]
MEKNCIFCKIASGEIPATKVHEDDKLLAFMDIAPANVGHTLIIPKKHHEILTDIPDDLLKGITLLTKKIARAILSALGAEGFNVIMNNKEVAGQVVPHAHIHIIPRYRGDGQQLHISPNPRAKTSVDETAEKIKKFL